MSEILNAIFWGALGGIIFWTIKKVHDQNEDIEEIFSRLEDCEEKLSQLEK